MNISCTSATPGARPTAIARRRSSSNVLSPLRNFLVSSGCKGCRGRVQHGDGGGGRVASRALRDSHRRDRAGGEARGIAHALARRRRAGDDGHAVEPEHGQAARELRLRCRVRHPAVPRACRSGREGRARVGRDARAGEALRAPDHRQGGRYRRARMHALPVPAAAHSGGGRARRSTSSTRRRPLRASCGGASNPPVCCRMVGSPGPRQFWTTGAVADVEPIVRNCGARPSRSMPSDHGGTMMRRHARRRRSLVVLAAALCLREAVRGREHRDPLGSLRRSAHLRGRSRVDVLRARLGADAESRRPAAAPVRRIARAGGGVLGRRRQPRARSMGAAQRRARARAKLVRRAGSAVPQVPRRVCARHQRFCREESRRDRRRVSRACCPCRASTSSAIRCAPCITATWDRARG